MWHLPEFMVPSWAAASGGILGITLFNITAVAFTVVITWMFNNTRASLPLAILVHASIDTFGGTLGAIFPADAVSSAISYLIGFGAVAHVLGFLEERRQQADGIKDLERARLDRRGARLVVRAHLLLDEPHVHAVAGELGGGEQPGGASADNQDVVWRHSITPGSQRSGIGV